MLLDDDADDRGLPPEFVAAQHLKGPLGVDTGGMRQSQRDWQTMVYAKPYAGAAEQNRIDFGAFNAIAGETIAALAADLAAAAAASDVVILNQQVPSGVSTSEMIEWINAIGVEGIMLPSDKA